MWFWPTSRSRLERIVLHCGTAVQYFTTELMWRKHGPGSLFTAGDTLTQMVQLFIIVYNLFLFLFFKGHKIITATLIWTCCFVDLKRPCWFSSWRFVFCECCNQKCLILQMLPQNLWVTRRTLMFFFCNIAGICKNCRSCKNLGSSFQQLFLCEGIIYVHDGLNVLFYQIPFINSYLTNNRPLWQSVFMGNAVPS